MKRNLQHFKKAGFAGLIAVCLLLCGCGKSSSRGYSSESLYRPEISSVCVKMFDNKSFRRGLEYELTDALAKRIEAETPYKVVSDAGIADSVISGEIVSINEAVLTTERNTGAALEKQAEVSVVVHWESARTGELLIDSAEVSASADFSNWQQRSFGYSSAVAANRLAEKIVELMQKDW